MHLLAQTAERLVGVKQVLRGDSPYGNMILGSIARSDVPDRANTRPASVGFGSAMPGGRHFKTFAMYTCSRANPTARSMELRSCPARPTKGSPWRSSSLRRLADDEPLSAQVAHAEYRLRASRAQAAACARGHARSQLGPIHAGLAGCRRSARRRSARRHRARRRRARLRSGRLRRGRRRSSRRCRDGGRGGTLRRGGLCRGAQRQDFSPRAARYSWRSSLFMRRSNGTASPPQFAVRPNRRGR